MTPFINQPEITSDPRKKQETVFLANKKDEKWR